MLGVNWKEMDLIQEGRLGNTLGTDGVGILYQWRLGGGAEKKQGDFLEREICGKALRELWVPNLDGDRAEGKVQTEMKNLVVGRVVESGKEGGPHRGGRHKTEVAWAVGRRLLCRGKDADGEAYGSWTGDVGQKRSHD